MEVRSSYAGFHIGRCDEVGAKVDMLHALVLGAPSSKKTLDPRTSTQVSGARGTLGMYSVSVAGHFSLLLWLELLV